MSARYVRIPEHYRDPNKSGLTYEVKSGAPPYEIKLSSSASGP